MTDSIDGRLNFEDNFPEKAKRLREMREREKRNSRRNNTGIKPGDAVKFKRSVDNKIKNGIIMKVKVSKYHIKFVILFYEPAVKSPHIYKKYSISYCNKEDLSYFEKLN